MNENLGISHFLAEINEKNEKLPLLTLIEKIQSLSLSRKSDKAKKFIELYGILDSTWTYLLEEVRLFCDLRDIVFHTDPRLETRTEMPKVAWDLIERLGVEIKPGWSWQQLLSDEQTLDWSENVFRQYFGKFDSSLGRNNQTIDEMDEMWGHIHKRLMANASSQQVTSDAP